jgi:hypothetical protein
MGILGSNFRLNLGVHRPIGDVMSRTPGVFARYSAHCNTRSQDGNTTVLATEAIPRGGYPPAAFYPPQVVGDMSFAMSGKGALTASLYASRSMTIDLTGAGTLEADAGLVVSMLLALAGSGDLSATIVGQSNMSIDLTGGGGLSATIAGIAHMIIDLMGAGSLEATISAYGNMAIDIVVIGTGLSTANVGQAVWESILNGDITAKDALLAAGSAGDPWITELPGNYTGSSAGALVKKIEKIIKDNQALILAKK